MLLGQILDYGHQKLSNLRGYYKRLQIQPLRSTIKITQRLFLHTHVDQNTPKTFTCILYEIPLRTDRLQRMSLQKQDVLPSFIKHPCYARGWHDLQTACSPPSVESQQTLLPNHFRKCRCHVRRTLSLQCAHHQPFPSHLQWKADRTSRQTWPCIEQKETHQPIINDIFTIIIYLGSSEKELEIRKGNFR